MSVRVLYVSGNIGLGHVTRDLAIAGAIRKRVPGVEISWLASEPALTVLREAGERLHPLARGYRSDTVVADKVGSAGGLSLLTYLVAVRREWFSHALTVRRLLSREHFDVVVGDETYDLLIAQMFHLLSVPVPFVMMYDFLGLDAMTSRWTERFGVDAWNAVWALDGRVLKRSQNTGVFIGELEDIPDVRFGPLMPNRRQHARRYYDFVGYVLPFDAESLPDRQALRSELGYGTEPLVVCSVGGLAIGRDLLELCGQAYPLLKQKLPDVRMVLVCGPSINPRSINVPEGLDVRGYVPQLYKHMAASDLAVVQSGGTTTIELTALERPFIYFPIEGQCEQEITIAHRLARHQAGIKMSRSTTTPADLAQAISDNLAGNVEYAPIPAHGAEKIADIVHTVL